MSSLDRYRKLEALGEGGAGAVYRAVDSVGGDVVAVKVLHSGLQSSTIVQRMAREVRTLRQLNHPGIVRVFDAGLHDGRPFLVMDLVEGETLGERVRRSGPFGQHEAAELVVALCEALNHAHDRGILHRDLKPENVLLDQRGRPFVTDFGLALELHDVQRLTRSGALLGTPGFLAPEQARGEKDLVGPATDVYGLGGVLYFALTGRPPFSGSGLHEVLVATLKRRPAPVRELRPEVDLALEAICLRCLEKDPVHRFDRAAYLGQALSTYLEQGAVAERGVPLRVIAVAVWSVVLAMLVWPQFAGGRTEDPLPPVARVTEEPAGGDTEATVPRSRLEQRLDSAQALLEEGRIERARQVAAEATALDDGSLEAWLLRAWIALELGEPQEAQVLLARAEELAPDDPRVSLNQARSLLDLGNYDEARVSFSRSLELLDDPHVRLERALATLDHGQRSEALADARHALAQGGLHVHDYGMLLEIFEATGAKEDHKRALESLVALPLSDPEQRLSRAELLLFEDPLAALDEADRLLLADPDLFPAQVVRGRALARLDRPEEALDLLNRALRRTPGRIGLLYDRALVNLRLRRVDEAREDWEQLVDRDPEDPLALANLAYAYLLREEVEDARDVLERMDELPWIPPEGFATRALLRQLEGDHLAAVHEAEQALSANPALEAPKVVLATSLEVLGRNRKALGVWREVLTWNRDTADRKLAESRIAVLERSSPER